MLVSTKWEYEAPKSLVIVDVKTRQTRFVGSLKQQAHFLRWSQDGKLLTLLLEPNSKDNSVKQHKSLISVALPKGEGVPFEQFDWKQTTPLHYTEVFAFPVGTEQVSWLER